MDLVGTVRMPAVTRDPLLQKRQDDDDDDETTTPSPTSTSDSSDATSATPSGTSDTSSSESTEASPPSALPSPLDSGLASSFTGRSGSSCPKFLNDLLSNDEFKSCYPVSMLLDVSQPGPSVIYLSCISPARSKLTR